MNVVISSVTFASHSFILYLFYFQSAEFPLLLLLQHCSSAACFNGANVPSEYAFAFAAITFPRLTPSSSRVHLVWELLDGGQLQVWDRVDGKCPGRDYVVGGDG